MLCDTQFWYDFLANFLSDLLVGVVIVLGVTAWLRWRSESKIKALRESKIKSLIAGELQQSQNRLRKLYTGDGELNGGHRRDLTDADMPAFLPDLLWTALLTGGELSCISDLDLLAALARAYDMIRFANRLLDAAMSSDIKPRRAHIREILPATAKIALQKIDHALEILLSERTGQRRR